MDDDQVSVPSKIWIVDDSAASAPGVGARSEPSARQRPSLRYTVECAVDLP